MKTQYCWRCQMDIPMLDEQEWEALSPLLAGASERLKAYREEHDVPLEEAKKHAHPEALDAYERITGFRETNFDALWHHRLALYGPPCHNCGRPLRTPQARLCGGCMAPRHAV